MNDATDESSTEVFDLIIVGSGSGNSIPDYLDGWKIAIVERDVFGGTCLNRGCIPSKMFVYPADVADAASSSDKLGIDTQFNGADWSAIRDRVFGRIDAISAGGREYRAEGNPDVTLIEGTAAFIDTHVLDVEGRRITAPNILLAAGARPVVPPIAGLMETGFHTSDSIMRLPELPKRLGIIGGGFIAVEMGHVFSALGSKVTLFNRSNMLLREFDQDVSDRFTEVFATRVDLMLGHVPTRVERVDDGIRIVSAAGESRGRRVAGGDRPGTQQRPARTSTPPASSCHHHGTVAVDDTMATNVPGIWAIGDLSNDYQLKHLANAEAAVAFWNIAHPDDLRHQSYKAVPSAVFSNPQVATVGLTEQEAVKQGRSFRVGRRDYAGTAYGWAMVDDTGFAKVLVDDQSGSDHRGARHRAAGVVDHPADHPGDGVRPAGR